MRPVEGRGAERHPLPRVLEGALTVFAEQGYHGATIRKIASACGLSVPGMYHYYQSKQDVLMGLMMAVMDDLLASTREAVQTVSDSPDARFDALVESLLRFHMIRQREALVASTEIRSLDEHHRRRYVARRDEQQQMIVDAVVEGRAAGVFATPHPRDAARGVATLCVGVASWYRPDGPLAPDELVSRHLGLARALVEATA